MSPNQITLEWEETESIVVDRKNRQTTFSRLNTEELAAWIDEYNIGDIWEMPPFQGMDGEINRIM